MHFQILYMQLDKRMFPDLILGLILDFLYSDVFSGFIMGYIVPIVVGIYILMVLLLGVIIVCGLFWLVCFFCCEMYDIFISGIVEEIKLNRDLKMIGSVWLGGEEKIILLPYLGYRVQWGHTTLSQAREYTKNLNSKYGISACFILEKTARGLLRREPWYTERSGPEVQQKIHAMYERRRKVIDWGCPTFWTGTTGGGEEIYKSGMYNKYHDYTSLKAYSMPLSHQPEADRVYVVRPPGFDELCDERHGVLLEVTREDFSKIEKETKVIKL